MLSHVFLLIPQLKTPDRKTLSGNSSGKNPVKRVETSLKLTANAPRNGSLEDDPFLLGFGLFSGANC